MIFTRFQDMVTTVFYFLQFIASVVGMSTQKVAEHFQVKPYQVPEGGAQRTL